MKNKQVKQMMEDIERYKYGKCSSSTKFKFEYGAVWVTRFSDGLGWLSRRVSPGGVFVCYGRLNQL